MKIITVTLNPTIDINSEVNQVIPERKLRCDVPRYEPGGGGINVSRAVKKLGGKSVALYLAGGTNGQFLQELLRDEQIENEPIAIKGKTRENLIIFEKSSEQQFRFGMPGPEVEEDARRRFIAELERVVAKDDYVVASGSLPRGVPDDFYAQIAAIGNKKGARVIVDTTGEPLRAAIEKGVFLIKPNLRELKLLCGQDIDVESQLELSVRKLLHRSRIDVIVVSLGAGGALLMTREMSKHLRTPTVPIKSKVGAGDSMVAGIVLALSQGRSLEKSVMYGVAAGAAAVMTPGTELCRKEDTDRLFECMISSDPECGGV
ncbi:1-phosphofructokinase family hexose kinase [candidate division KSB1 bacterium]|nr:1-phosphofructokinase family hexose kinase [candidate division KSB1 bacterium]